MKYTKQQAKYFAEQILLKRSQTSIDGLASAMSGVKVDLNPHQVDAALFAMKSPLSNGVIMADEVGLGKTIEAGLVLAQYWSERKRKILLIVPASLRMQWRVELNEKFFIDSIIMESAIFNKLKKMEKNCEFVISYAKNYDLIAPFHGAYDYTEMYEYVTDYRNQGKNWHYTSVLINQGEKVYVGSTLDGDGNEIKIYQRPGAIVKSVRQIMQSESLTEKDVYYRYGTAIFEDKDAQSSIRTRVALAKKELGITDDIISIEYIPKTGKNKGKLYEQFYKGDKCRLFAWLRDISEEKDGVLYKKDLQGTYWDLTTHINNLTKEGGVSFPKGKKPEALVGRIIEMATEPNDYVLDSFLGSGTTSAAATKLNRKWIGIELGDHCFTHCIPRLKSVIDGADNGGITNSSDWKGGGGYKFYELASTLIEKDKYGNPVFSDKYNAEMLTAAVAKINGFAYYPDANVFWKQGISMDNSYIYVTTQYFTAEMLDGIAKELSPMEKLLICAPAFDIGLSKRYDNINVKKIPQSVLDKCEFGVDNYNLNIVDIPEIDEEELLDD